MAVVGDPKKANVVSTIPPEPDRPAPVSFPRSSARALSVAALACLCGCVEPPDDIEVLEGSELDLDSQNYLATARIEVEGGELEQGPNTVDVRFEAVDGATRVKLAEAGAFMPAHGHGTNPPIVTEAGDGYRIDDLNLFMPGHWEITLAVTVGDAKDSFRFAAEIE